MLGVLSSHSTLCMLVGALFKKFGLFFQQPSYQCCFKGCLSFTMKHPILSHVIYLTFIIGISVCFSPYHLNYRIFSQFVLFIFVKPFFQKLFCWNFYFLAVFGSNFLDSSLIVFCSIAVNFIVQQFSPGVLQSFRLQLEL